MREIEQDGFITNEIYIQETAPRKPKTLEWVAEDRGKMMESCIYPKCEDCNKYVATHCTVPIVVSKEAWLTYEDFKKTVSDTISDMNDVINYILYDVLDKKRETKRPHDDERELYDKTLVEIAGEDDAVLDV